MLTCCSAKSYAPSYLGFYRQVHNSVFFGEPDTDLHPMEIDVNCLVGVVELKTVEVYIFHLT